MIVFQPHMCVYDTYSANEQALNYCSLDAILIAFQSVGTQWFDLIRCRLPRSTLGKSHWKDGVT